MVDRQQSRGGDCQICRTGTAPQLSLNNQTHSEGSGVGRIREPCRVILLDTVELENELILSRTLLP